MQVGQTFLADTDPVLRDSMLDKVFHAILAKSFERSRR